MDNESKPAPTRIVIVEAPLEPPLELPIFVTPANEGDQVPPQE